MELGGATLDLAAASCLSPRLTPSAQHLAERSLREVLEKAGCFPATVGIEHVRHAHTGEPCRIGGRAEAHWDLYAYGYAPTCAEPSTDSSSLFALTGLYDFEVGR